MIVPPSTEPTIDAALDARLASCEVVAMTSALTYDDLVKTPLGGLLCELRVGDEGATDTAKEVPWHVGWQGSEVEDISSKTYKAIRPRCDLARSIVQRDRTYAQAGVDQMTIDSVKPGAYINQIDPMMNHT